MECFTWYPSQCPVPTDLLIVVYEPPPPASKMPPLPCPTSKEASPLTKKVRLNGGVYGDCLSYDDDGHSFDVDGHGDAGDVDIHGGEDGDADDGNAAAAVGSGGGVRKRKKPWRVHGPPDGSMHNANLYKHYRPDFRELAMEYPGAHK